MLCWTCNTKIMKQINVLKTMYILIWVLFSIYQYNWRNPKTKKNLHFMIACTMNLEKGTNQCNNNLMNWIFLCLYAHGLFFVGISYLFVRFGKIWCVIIIWHVIVFDVVIYPIYIIRFTFINIYNPKTELSVLKNASKI